MFTLQYFFGYIFSITVLHDNIEKLRIFLNLMAVPGYSKDLHLMAVSMEEGGGSCAHLTSEHVIPAYKPSSVITLTFALVWMLPYCK